MASGGSELGALGVGAWSPDEKRTVVTAVQERRQKLSRPPLPARPLPPRTRAAAALSTSSLMPCVYDPWSRSGGVGRRAPGRLFSVPGRLTRAAFLLLRPCESQGQPPVMALFWP